MHFVAYKRFHFPQIMFDVIISVDPGMSLTKVFYMRWPDGQVEYLSMGSEIKQIKPEYLLDFGLDGGRLEDNAMVKKLDGRLLVFGQKARNMEGKPPEELNKYGPGVERILAVVGCIACRLNLPSSFTIALSVVLPYSEYQDQQRFRELLTPQLADFHFGEESQHYSVSVPLLDVKPEGAGLGLIEREKNKSAFDSSNVLVLMNGARDTSLLPFVKGTPQKGVSEKMGFNRLVEALKLHAALNLSLGESSLLPELIFKAKSDPKSIARIARMVVSDHEQAAKSQQLLAAIETCQAKYWDDFKTWLKNSLSQSIYALDKVILSGGAALYFREELEDFFHSNEVQISWSSGLAQQITNLLNEEVDEVTAFRFADAFGTFRLLAGKAKNTEVVVRQAS